MLQYRNYRIPTLPSDYVKNVNEAIYGAHNLLHSEIKRINPVGFKTIKGDLNTYVSLETASAMLYMSTDEINRWSSLGALRETDIDNASYIDGYSILHFMSETQNFVP